MAWQPGQLAITPEDRAAWEQWRKGRKAEQQRARRAKLSRVDFEAAEDVQTVLFYESITHGEGNSAILNRIIREWAALNPNRHDALKQRLAQNRQLTGNDTQGGATGSVRP